MALFGKQKNEISNSAELCSRAVAEAGHDVHLLIRKNDLYPLYIGGNFESVFGISPERLEEDIEALMRLMTDTSRLDVKRITNEWNGENELSFDFSFKRDDSDEVESRRCTIAPVNGNTDFLVTFNDVSLEHKRVEELEKQVEEATGEAHIKADFLNNMSHEIRTPLNGILGLLGLARDRATDDDELLEDLQQADELGKYLLSLVNDILDMSRIESGKVELENNPFDLSEFGRDLKAMFEGQAQTKKINYSVELEDCPHRYVRGDRLRLSQVIVNFISNSMKFTNSGGKVDVVIKEMYYRNEKVHIMIRVRDTGKGMSPQFLGRIFRPFEQEDAGIASKYGGSGLGMAIADSLVKLMRGEIVVDSQLGKGSEFSVYIPFDVSDESEIIDERGEIDTAASEPFARPVLPEFMRNSHTKQPNLTSMSATESGNGLFSGMRALVAEDNDINAKILIASLNTWGVSVEHAIDGNDAVKMFCEHESDYFDFILMDIQMPDKNGWEATLEIRENEIGTKKHVPIIALSANAYVEDVRRSTEVGMDGHVEKPVDFNELEAFLKKLLLPNRTA